jgi:hypothetical protein
MLSDKTIKDDLTFSQVLSEKTFIFFAISSRKCKVEVSVNPAFCSRSSTKDGGRPSQRRQQQQEQLQQQ